MLTQHLKLLAVTFALACSICSCASSDNKQHTTYPNQVQLTEPGAIPYTPGKVYIDAIKQISTGASDGLLISGSFSDGCTHLQAVLHNIEDDSLSLKISAWRNKEAVCTQALVPFSFIYDKLSSQQLNSYSQVSINGQTYSF
ncbi:hypothetical protein [Fodinibius salsisoli]|uniref:Lipoprotein n=1 Tax=Fodinibius salsisoli TaxID=2820877 RepID=A0ABT3PNL1_9BACT|nr:hypothetical protein [Fodinibius salsisoli]MCW9707437.1 hypothetical protein [Fodinibius salsisoli]